MIYDLAKKTYWDLDNTCRNFFFSIVTISEKSSDLTLAVLSLLVKNAYSPKNSFFYLALEKC